MYDNIYRSRGSMLMHLVLVIVLLAGSCTPNKTKSSSLLPNKKLLYDKIRLLSPAQFDSLNRVLLNYEDQTSTEIAIYITDKIPGGVNFDQYAAQMINDLGIGKPGINNGILIFFSRNDGFVRLDVGHGFEWSIDKKESNDIVLTMINFFDKEQFYVGFRTAIDGLMQLTKNISWARCTEGNKNCVIDLKIKKSISFSDFSILVESVEGRQYNINISSDMYYFRDKIVTVKESEPLRVLCRSSEDSNHLNLIGIQ